MGVVTTTTVQHASPAGAYAHTVNRNWYSDANMPAEAKREGCQDIATQMVYNMDIDVSCYMKGKRQGWEEGVGHTPDSLGNPQPWGLGRSLYVCRQYCWQRLGWGGSGARCKN